MAKGGNIEEVARLGIGLSLETGNFTKKMSTINKEIKRSETEFKKASKGVVDYENTFTGLSHKIDKTQKQIDLYNVKLKEQQEEYKKLNNDLEASKRKLEEIETTQGKNSKAWKEQAELVAKNSDKLVTLSKNIDETTSNIDKLTTDLATSKDKFDNLGKSSETLEEKLDKIKQEAEQNQAAFDKLGEELAESGSVFERFENTLNSLKNKMESTQNIIDLYENELSQLDTTLKSSQKAHEQLAKDIADTERALQQSKDQYGENSQEARELGSKLNALKDDYNKLDKEIDQTKTAMNKCSTEINDAKDKLESLGNEVRKIPFDEMIKELDNAKEKVGDLGDKTEKLSQGMAAIGGASIIAFAESSNATSKLQGALGLTKEEAEKVTDSVQNLNKKGFQFDEALETITVVKQTMSELLDPSEVENFTGNVLALTNTFDQDYNDVVKTASTMMKNFGIDGTEALDIISYGFQNGLNVADDWLDTLWEYSVQFDDLGFTADETLKIIENGMSLGIFNTDKLADMLKEANIRMSEMGKDQTEAIKSLGLNAETVQSNITKGGEAASKQMIDVARKVLEIEDPIKQNQVAVAIFGTMFEDLGIDGVKALADIDQNMSNVKGTTDQVTKSFENSFGAQIQGMIAELKEPLEKIGLALLPILDNTKELIIQFAEWFSSLDQGTIEAITGFGVFAMGISPVFKAISGVLGVTSTLTGKIKDLGGDFDTLGNTKVTGLITKMGGLSSVAIPVLIGALVGIAATIGDNEEAIFSLQEKWGGFGTVIGGVCEFISGAVQITLGNVVSWFQLGFDVIGALMDGKGGDTPQKAWERHMQRMESNTQEGWDKITLRTTGAMASLRELQVGELNNVTSVYETILSEIPNITDGKYGEASQRLATQLNGMGSNQIKVLRGMNEATNVLFTAINENMSIDEAKAQLEKNFELAAKQGKLSATDLEKGISAAMELINKNMGDKSKQGKDSINSNMQEAEKAVSKATQGMKTSTETNMNGSDKAMQENATRMYQGVTKSFSEMERKAKEHGTNMYRGVTTSTSTMSQKAREDGTNMYRGVTTSASQMSQKAKEHASSMYRGVTTSTNKMANAAISDWNRIRNAYSRSIKGTIIKTTIHKTEKRNKLEPQVDNLSNYQIDKAVDSIFRLPNIENYDIRGRYFNSEDQGKVISEVKGTKQTPKNNNLEKLLLRMIELMEEKEDKPVPVQVLLDSKVIAETTADHTDKILGKKKFNQSRMKGHTKYVK